MTYNELDNYCSNNIENYEDLKKNLLNEISRQIIDNEITMQQGGIIIIQKTIELSKIEDPIYVIGLLPPYCPAVNSVYFEDNIVEDVKKIVSKTLHEKYNIKLETEAYFMGISDYNFISLTQIDNEIKTMKEMVVPEKNYNIDFENIKKISMPCVFVGAWGKDIHTIKERVYMPYLEHVSKDVVKAIIKYI